MFDSSIFEENPDIDCYNKLRTEENKFDNIQQVIDEQNSKRDNTIEKIKENLNIKNIVFACHHPIFSFKKKDEKCKFHCETEIIKFLLPFNVLSDKKFIYLCADLHLFQRSRIVIKYLDSSLTLEHVVVGTGGAELDDICNQGDITRKIESEKSKKESEIQFLEFLPLEDSDINFVINEDYVIEEEIISIKSNGFLHCKFLEKIYMEFINTSNVTAEITESKGGKKSNKKRKKGNKNNKSKKRNKSKKNNRIKF